MAFDDLSAPLGQFRVPEQPQRRRARSIAVILASAGVLIAAGWHALEGPLLPSNVSQAGNVSPPQDSRPREALPAAALRAPPRLVLEHMQAQDALLRASAASAPENQEDDGLDAAERRTGVKVIRAGGGAAPGALVIDVAKALRAGTGAVADPRVTGQSRYGPIPRIGQGGARPSRIYSRPVNSQDGESGQPRVALVVGGMGLAPRTTEAAIASLPGAVTLAFAPYGGGISRLAARAREAGHEILLQIPMEPFDFPGGLPGPHTLLAGADDAVNVDHLDWHMSRFTGYTGIMSFLGGKLTADAKALKPVLNEVSARGLFYLDDGTSPQSLAMALAPGLGLAAARADIVLDPAAEPGALEASLARLEAIARERGVAIGVASALPASIAAAGRFARELPSRGILLIPLSAAIFAQQHGAVADFSPAR